MNQVPRVIVIWRETSYVISVADDQLKITVFKIQNGNSENLAVQKSVQDMYDILRCDKCKKLLNNPRSLGGCSHIFCKDCTQQIANKICPACGTPYELKACRPDHSLADILTSFQALSDVLGIKLSQETHVGPEEPHAEAPTPQPIEQNSVLEKITTKAPSPKLNESSSVHNTTADSISNKTIVTPRRNSTGKRDVLQTSMSRGSSTPGSHSKRNAKGETPLQRAVIKGNVALVKDLLAEGATPNTKDFAGWTPLHEACQRDFTEIIQILLEHGAKVNTPGMGNTTPLHDAVQAYKLEAVRLLVSHGANLQALDDKGKTPIDYATNEIMKAALNTKPLVTIATARVIEEYCAPEKPVFWKFGQNAEEASLLEDLVRLVKGRVIASYNSRVDFVVVMSGQAVSQNLGLFSALLDGKWVVGSDWVKLCLTEGKLADPRPFEVQSLDDYPQSEAFPRSRRNSEQQLPKLFNNCWFYLHGTFKNPSKQDIVKLVKEGGGVILSRSPNPEAIPVEERKRPYHAAPDSDLAECSHYIIYQPGAKNEPAIKYNMKHMKALPLQWLLDCMGNFSLINPASYIH